MQILLDPLAADGGGTPAGDSLASPAATDAAGAAKTITIPADLLPEAKPGDTFKVQSVADGNVTLEHESGGEGDDWSRGLQEAAPRTDEGAM
jgi:hypothetical protein